jgi:hypothetical protein
MTSRAAATSSVTKTLTVGAMSNPSRVRPARAAPSSRCVRNSATCSGANSVGIQPSAISPASAVFFGPIAAR